MATREQLIEDFADHKYATGEKFERLINSMKVVQEPVTDPAASGTSLSFIDSIEQDKDGKITATKKTLDLSNAHELNPFKGWWKTGDTLPTSGFDGAYLYFKDTTQTPAVTTIYQWNGTAYAPTGTVVDTSNVQTFGSGQAVNAVKIKDENGDEDAGAEGVLSAEAGKELNFKVGGDYSFQIIIQTAGNHSSNLDRQNLFVPAGKFSITVESGTTTGGMTPYVHYTDGSSGSLAAVYVGRTTMYITTKDIDSIGFYIANAAVGTIDFTIRNYESLVKTTEYVEELSEKSVSVIPIVQKDFGPSASEQTIYAAANFAVGSRYRLVIESTTGITFDDETYTGTNTLLEFVGGGLGDILIPKTDTINFPLVYEFTAESSNLRVYRLRCHSNEYITAKLYKFGNLENRVTNAEGNIEEFKNFEDITNFKIDGVLVSTLTIPSDAPEHSAANDRIPIQIKAGARFNIAVELGTSSTTSSGVTPVVHYVGESGNTGLSGIAFGQSKDYTAAKDIDSIGFYISQPKAGTIIFTFTNYSSLNEVNETIAKLGEKVSTIPIASGEYSRQGSPGLSTSAILAPSSVFEAGETYQLELSSDTGISWDDSTYPNITNVLEIAAANSFSDAGGTFYILTKTQTFAPITITFTVNEPDNIRMVASRYHADEKLIVNVYKLGSIEKQLLTEKSFAEIHEEELKAVNVAKLNYYQNDAAGKNYHITILQMTDTHSDWTALRKGFELANLKFAYDIANPNTLSNYFDMILHTGDIGEGSVDFNNFNWKSIVMACEIPVLAIPGNHEFEYVAGNPTYVGYTDEGIYNKLYDADLQTKNGDVHPVISNVTKNYYHRDVTKNGVTVRMIFFYQFEWNPPINPETEKPLYGNDYGKDVVFYTQDQIDWFVQTLQDATTAGYPVIVVSHLPLSRYNYVDCGFDEDATLPKVPFFSSAINESTGRRYDAAMFTFMGNLFFFEEIIDAFVNGTSCQTSTDQVTSDGVNHPLSVNTTFNGNGKFLCNICGHYHTGGILKMVKNTGTQQVPVIEETNYHIISTLCATPKTTQNRGLWNRVDDKSKYGYQVIVYDSLRDKIKVIRIGPNLSNRMLEAKYYVI